MEIKLLPCPLCTTPHFEGVESLRTSLVKIATNLVTCPICLETLLGLDKLTIHLFSHIENLNQSKSELQDNIQEEINKKIENECRNSAEELVKCDICNFSFADKNILDIHQQLLHQTSPDQKTGNYSYHCHLCSKKFKMRGSLMVHLRVAHYGFVRKETQSHTGCSENKLTNKKNEAKQELDSEVKSDTNGHSKFQDNKQWECDVCSKLFTTKYFLKKHKRLHTGEMPYCCNLCNKLFTFQQSYHKHMLYHSAEKPHVCNECGRAFKELSTLQNHARIHSGERPFICETCGKSFRQRVSYLVHRRIHTGAMPYKCTICDKNFRYKVSQKSHKCITNSVPNSEATTVPKNNLNSPQSLPYTITKMSQLDGSHQTNSTTTKCIMNVDLDTGNISVIPQNHTTFDADKNVSNGVQKRSILLNNNELIEISYNKEDLKDSNDNTVDRGKTTILENQDVFEKLIYADQEKELLLSPTLSTLLPDVESLYLNSSPVSLEDNNETINDMREKCLEEFLQGME